MLRDQIIKNMCSTWRHDYGLLNDNEQKSLFMRMAQIFDNDIAPEFKKIEKELYEKQCQTEALSRSLYLCIRTVSLLVESIEKSTVNDELLNKVLLVLRVIGTTKNIKEK